MTDLVRPARATPRRPASRGPASAWSRRAASALALSGVTACYSTVPLQPAPAPGTRVVLDLNDQGRVELGDRIGPGAMTVGALLDARTDTSMQVRVRSVSYLNGQTNTWSGESMTIPTRLVGQARQQNFSRTRSASVGAAIVAGIVLIITKTNLIGSSSGGTREPGGGGGSS